MDPSSPHPRRQAVPLREELSSRDAFLGLLEVLGPGGDYYTRDIVALDKYGMDRKKERKEEAFMAG